MMTIAEMEELLDKNKHIKQVPKGINIVSITCILHIITDIVCYDTLSQIFESHPDSPLSQHTPYCSLLLLRTSQSLHNIN